MLTDDQIVALAREDAEEAARLARASAEPIVFLTGNSHMPPLRAFGHGEQVYQDEQEPDSGDAFELYVEIFERECEQRRIHVGVPEYDNSVYAVDCSRFQFREFLNAEEAETLSSEWEPYEPDVIGHGKARRIASDWHSGQWSALYALASSGAILPLASDVIAEELVKGQSERDLEELLAYVEHYGLRGPQEGWADQWED